MAVLEQHASSQYVTRGGGISLLEQHANNSPPVAQGEPEVPLVYALENLVGIDDEVTEDAIEAVEG